MLDHGGQVPTPALSELIACPTCDALYRAEAPAQGERAICARCHHVLIAPKTDAFLRLIALSTTILILMVGATLFPFLSVNAYGFGNNASVLSAALAFLDGGPMALLGVAVAAFIVAIPVLRAALVIYAVAPLVMGGRPFRNARRAFRLSEDLRPWSMAEIFVIGVAVALTKVADLADVGFGPAFWMFAALVVIVVLQDGTMDRWSVWKALEERRR